MPDLDHDMHDGTVGDGRPVAARATSAATPPGPPTHNSLLVLTWDEDDRSQSNRVVTVVAGAHVATRALRRARRPLPAAQHAGGARARPARGPEHPAAPVTSIWAP